jgi:hypothetical protein
MTKETFSYETGIPPAGFETEVETLWLGMTVSACIVAATIVPI